MKYTIVTVLHSSEHNQKNAPSAQSQLPGTVFSSIILTIKIQDVYRRAVSLSPPPHSALAPEELRNGPITVYMSCPDRVGTLHHRGHNIYSPLLSKLPKLFLMDRKSNTVNCPPRRGGWEGA